MNPIPTAAASHQTRAEAARAVDASGPRADEGTPTRSAAVYAERDLDSIPGYF